jgi:hypothetical protein
MKLSCKIGIFLALFAAVCLPAMAQSSMKVNIPFNFSVKGKSLLAGQYTVAKVVDGSNGSWSVSGYHGGVLMITSDVSRQKAHRPGLVFWRSGDTYSLIQIWTGECGRELFLRPKVKATLLAQDGTYVEIAGE